MKINCHTITNDSVRLEMQSVRGVIVGKFNYHSNYHTITEISLDKDVF